MLENKWKNDVGSYMSTMIMFGGHLDFVARELKLVISSRNNMTMS